MSKLRFNITMSLDGFVAGPNQSVENPLGVGGMALHEWAFPLAAFREAHGEEGGEVNESTPVMEGMSENVGAGIMGRGMFGGGPGPWGDEPWNGWWGDDPPFDVPVFVLTNHPREPLHLGDTSFTFVPDGSEPALEQPRAAAGDKDVHVAGGASAAQQYLRAGLLDEVELHVVPILLGGGVRLFEDVPADAAALEIDRVVASPQVTHIRYRVAR